MKVSCIRSRDFQGNAVLPVPTFLILILSRCCFRKKSYRFYSHSQNRIRIPYQILILMFSASQAHWLNIISVLSLHKIFRAVLFGIACFLIAVAPLYILCTIFLSKTRFLLQVNRTIVISLSNKGNPR